MDASSITLPQGPLVQTSVAKDCRKDLKILDNIMGLINCSMHQSHYSIGLDDYDAFSNRPQLQRCDAARTLSGAAGTHAGLLQ